MNEHFPHRPPFSFHSLPCLISFLYVQIEDRRSSVNKQACFTLTALAAALGTRFQDHAAYFLPSLFKVLPITVLVGSRVALPGMLNFLPVTRDLTRPPLPSVSDHGRVCRPVLPVPPPPVPVSSPCASRDSCSNQGEEQQDTRVVLRLRGPGERDTSPVTSM